MITLLHVRGEMLRMGHGRAAACWKAGRAAQAVYNTLAGQRGCLCICLPCCHSTTTSAALCGEQGPAARTPLRKLGARHVDFCTKPTLAGQEGRLCRLAAHGQRGGGRQQLERRLQPVGAAASLAHTPVQHGCKGLGRVKRVDK